MSFSLPWQMVVQRVLLAVVIVLPGQCGLDRAVRAISRRSGNTLVNAPMQVAHTPASVTDPQVVLTDVRCPNPHNTSHNLLEADRVSLKMAAQPLFHKQAIIDHGTVVGLRVNTATKPSSDPNTAATAPSTAWFTDAAGE